LDEIAGIFYYFYTKKKSGKETVSDTKEDWLELENWKDIALEHMAKFPKRTGKSRPTYEEMLELDEDEFKAWLFVKGEGDNQEQTLKEMIEHESRTGSFTKTARNDVPPHEQLILNVFDKDKSTETIKALNLNGA
jgi:sarcosine oxidase delta subunit